MEPLTCCLRPKFLLATLLGEGEYALALAPHFFGFYAHIGFLAAVDECGFLSHVTHVAGSSAGALVGGFVASGLSPTQMASSVFKINRESIWDAGLGLGLLKGNKLQQLLEDELPPKIQTFDKCKISFGVTTFSLTQMRTVTHTSGALATAMRASACFPGLFTPVAIDDTLHIDGGVFDRTGMMGLTGLPKSGLVVNVVFHLGAASELPPQLSSSNATILTIVLSNIPQVHPFSMDTAGPAAYRAAKNATLRALTEFCHVQRPAINHYICYIEATEQDWGLQNKEREISKTKTKTKSKNKSRRGSSAVKHSRVTAKRA